ncbi:MAG: hypothetical protein IAF38_15725 [Bacteroidia bacterium]|nr:hypothetical protein [Bacteroidia bacterium]
MTSIVIKKKLIQQIQKTKNVGILEEVYRLLEIEETDMEVLKLSETQKKKINRAKEDVKHGRVISNAKANKEIDKWLKK